MNYIFRFAIKNEKVDKAQIFQDGINADRIGNDYIKLEKTIESSSKQEFKLAPGGGFVIKLKAM